MSRATLSRERFMRFAPELLRRLDGVPEQLGQDELRALVKRVENATSLYEDAPASRRYLHQTAMLLAEHDVMGGKGAAPLAEREVIDDVVPRRAVAKPAEPPVDHIALPLRVMYGKAGFTPAQMVRAEKLGVDITDATRLGRAGGPIDDLLTLIEKRVAVDDVLLTVKAGLSLEQVQRALAAGMHPRQLVNFTAYISFDEALKLFAQGATSSDAYYIAAKALTVDDVLGAQARGIAPATLQHVVGKHPGSTTADVFALQDAGFEVMDYTGHWWLDRAYAPAEVLKLFRAGLVNLKADRDDLTRQAAMVEGYAALGFTADEVIRAEQAHIPLEVSQAAHAAGYDAGTAFMLHSAGLSSGFEHLKQSGAPLDELISAGLEQLSPEELGAFSQLGFSVFMATTLHRLGLKAQQVRELYLDYGLTPEETFEVVQAGGLPG
ncbi:MAG: hypothetical protein IPJ65_10145 [Archangiaceae bacterium]|nr:hypothetical protein [Archangiaceae bacterium]